MRRKGTTAYLDILARISKGSYGSQIAKELNKTPATITYYLKTLEKMKLVRSKGGYPKIYELTPQGRVALVKKDIREISLGKRGPWKSPGRWHNLGVKLPILKDNPNVCIGKKVKLKGWTKEIEKVERPGLNITLVRTPKHLIAWVPEINAGPTKVAMELSNIALLTCHYASKKYGIVLDFLAREFIRGEVAHRLNPNFKIKKSSRVMLGRKARSVDGTLKDEEAYASIDFSPGKGKAEIETNDLDYDTKLELMPELVMAQSEILTRFTEQLGLHLDVLEGIEGAFKKFNELLEKKGTSL